MTRQIKKLALGLALSAASMTLHAAIFERGNVQLFCHRTANRDAPENTLESLALAARMGCNLVEVDVRMTLDGQLVLNHDGYLERLTDGMGDVSDSTYAELQMLDYGGWMAKRFSPMRVPLLVDALRLAKEKGITLDLDIKQRGEGAAIYAALEREGMIGHVIFGGDDGNADDLKAIYPSANQEPMTWLGTSVSAAEVEALHAKGRFIVANFSNNPHEMDLPAMHAAVIAGVDAISVDYPRLGADAVGRPVESRLAALSRDSLQGETAKRVSAILELAAYDGFPTEQVFVKLLHDPDQHISRTAAVALVRVRPATSSKVFLRALSAPETSARRNAAWALGITHATVSDALLALLQSKDAGELTEVLLALSRCPGNVPEDTLLPFLSSTVPTVRAAASLALAKHQPEMAASAVPALLQQDEQRSATAYAVYVRRGKPKLTQAEIDPIVEEYREHMKLVHALEELPEEKALPLLAKEAFRSAEDPSHVTSLVAGYGLWDRIAEDPSLAIAHLDAADIEVVNRAEWVLIKADVAVLPRVRAALLNSTPAVRRRLIDVLAWKGDAMALPLLHQLAVSDSEDHELLRWATEKISTLQFNNEDVGHEQK